MTFLITLLLLVLAAAGFMAQRSESPALTANADRPRAIIGAVGGYAAGVLAVWFCLTLLRVLALTPLQQLSFFEFMRVGPAVFRFEQFVLLVFLALQLGTLGGIFTAKDEWWSSIYDGGQDAITFIAVSSVLAVAVWFFIAPKPNQTYQPHIDFATPSVRASLPMTLDTSQEIEVLDRLDSRAAIPNAVAWGTIFGFFGWLVFASVNRFRREMKRKHQRPPLPPEFLRQIGGMAPRGGEPN